jgi:hypothetical protein
MISRKLKGALTLAGAAVAFSLFAAGPVQAGSAMMVRDFVLTNGIYEREPVNTTEDFMTSDGTAYAFARINNDGEPSKVSFIWQYQGSEHASVDQTIGTSGSWRTWSSVNLKPGDWRVQLVTEDGRVIAERTFKVDDTMSPTSGT